MCILNAMHTVGEREDKVVMIGHSLLLYLLFLWRERKEKSDY